MEKYCGKPLADPPLLFHLELISGLNTSQTEDFLGLKTDFIFGFMRDAPRQSTFFLTHSVLASPDVAITCSIAAYSGGDSRVENIFKRVAMELDSEPVRG